MVCNISGYLFDIFWRSDGPSRMARREEYCVLTRDATASWAWQRGHRAMTSSRRSPGRLDNGKKAPNDKKAPRRWGPVAIHNN